MIGNPDRHIVLDAIKDFHELTKIKIAAERTGLFMIGGGVPKNFTQDTVICAEELHHSSCGTPPNPTTVGNRPDT